MKKKEIITFVGFLVLLVLLFVFKDRLQVDDNMMPVSIEPEMIKVYLYGEVKNPGVYELNYNDRLEEAINLAGGFTSEADQKINLAQKLEDGQMITIYKKKTYQEGVAYSGLDILNYGDENAILEVNGIGEVLCSRIIAYREENGFFREYADLLNVDGIGESKLESIQKYLEIN